MKLITMSARKIKSKMRSITFQVTLSISMKATRIGVIMEAKQTVLMSEIYLQNEHEVPLLLPGVVWEDDTLSVRMEMSGAGFLLLEPSKSL